MNTLAPPGVHSIHAAFDVLACRLQAPPVRGRTKTKRMGHTSKAHTSAIQESLGRKGTGRSVSPRTDFDAARPKPVNTDRRGSQCDLSRPPYRPQSHPSHRAQSQRRGSSNHSRSWPRGRPRRREDQRPVQARRSRPWRIGRPPRSGGVELAAGAPSITAVRLVVAGARCVAFNVLIGARVETRQGL